jgi:hypothetical protein
MIFPQPGIYETIIEPAQKISQLIDIHQTRLAYTAQDATNILTSLRQGSLVFQNAGVDVSATLQYRY